MSLHHDRLRELVPGVYRSRDAALDGAPLDRLLGVVAQPLDSLAAAIRQLEDDHFVERADPEALPLLAALLGVERLPADTSAARALLARTVGWRRRRGTLPTLEEVIALTSGWPAEVDEAFRSLAHHQDLRHLVPWRGRTTEVFDPIALADPLSRRVVVDRYQRTDSRPTLSLDPDRVLDDVLRDVGRADAGRHAVSPRSLDLRGWARPGIVVIRTSRFRLARIDEATPGSTVAVVQRDDVVLDGVHLDPLDRDVHLAWEAPVEPAELLPRLTERHEPDATSDRELRTAPALLSPTALAEDGDGVEALDAVRVAVHGVTLVGEPAILPARTELPYAPARVGAVLAFADTSRPDPADHYVIKALGASSDGDVVGSVAEATRGMASPAVVVDDAERAGHQLVVRVRRLAGAGRRRDAAGAWSEWAFVGRVGLPRSPAVVLDIGGQDVAVRVERDGAGAPVLTRALLGAADLEWSALSLAGDLPQEQPGLAAAAVGGEVWLFGEEADASALWRISFADVDNATVAAVAVGGGVSPSVRRDASLGVHDGRLVLYGGRDGEAVLEDLWSLDPAAPGDGWRPHVVRDATPRVGAALLSRAGELVILGGQDEDGDLVGSVAWCDLTTPRPRWRELPALPHPEGAPGAVVAWLDGVDLRALVWADHTRPRALHLLGDAARWRVSPPEADAANPPAAGELVAHGGEVLVLGPPPLPPSEVLVTVGASGFLAFLPALDLVPRPLDVGESIEDDEGGLAGVGADGWADVEVSTDGTTARRLAGAELPPERPGGSLATAMLERVGQGRFGVPGGLRWRPYRLRQRGLSRWTDARTALQDPSVVGLDPRLGRVLLPAGRPPGPITVSYAVGRPNQVGVGQAPVDRDPPATWSRDPVDRPPYVADRDGIARWPDTTEVAAPAHEGALTSLDAALDALDEASPLVGLVGSVDLPAARVRRSSVGFVATDVGAVPRLGDGTGPAMTVSPDADDPDLELWLAGLWLLGPLELFAVRGLVDARWCTLGALRHRSPALGVRVAGAGHEPTVAHRTLPEATLTLRLVGCRVGAIALPPWVSLHAIGCTLDAGSDDAVAVSAPGARVHLEHCTVRGYTLVGSLEASSCVFTRSVHTARPDLGWLRFSVLPQSGQPPRSYRCLPLRPGLASTDPNNPRYLLLAENNGEAVWTAGEDHRLPGAGPERAERQRELRERTSHHLPVGLAPFHVDRTAAQLARSARRTP